jgi:hypothetical protein
VVLSLTLRDGENTHTGGFTLNRLKKLKGLRLTFPSASTVEARQIGLGATAWFRYACICNGERSFVWRVSIFIIHAVIARNEAIFDKQVAYFSIEDCHATLAMTVSLLKFLQS